MKKMISLVCALGFMLMLASSSMADDPKIPPRIPQRVPQKVQIDKSKLMSPKLDTSKIEAIKKYADFLASACSEGYYYKQPGLTDAFESKNIWGCDMFIKCFNEGGCQHEAMQGKEIKSSYVCHRGYPIPQNPCPAGYELISDTGLTSEKQAGSYSPVYGCKKTGTITTNPKGFYQPTCKEPFDADTYSGGWLACEGQDYSDSNYQACIAQKKNGSLACKGCNLDNIAIQECCNKDLELVFWCYAEHKDMDYNPCGTSDAIWIDNAIPFGHGGCCIFAE